MVCFTASVTLLKLSCIRLVGILPLSSRVLRALDLVNDLRLRSIHSFFCLFGCILRLSNDFNSVRKIEFIVLDLENSFLDSLVVYSSVFQPFLHHGPLYAIKKFGGTPNKIL